MSHFLTKASRAASGDSDPTTQVFAEYMANIVKQLPGNLTMLRGTANAQASFFFQSAETSAVNETLYNALLSPRVEGRPALYGVPQAQLVSSAFVTAYLQLYSSLRYQLSQEDKATMQRILAEVANSISSLRPIWNAWVGATSDTKVPKLNMEDTQIALMQLTSTLTGAWLNPEFKEKLENDPAYPYEHMSDFDQIFSGIPLSVPATMRNGMKAVYNVQGAAGVITAKQSNATQIINGILANIQHPTLESGGLKLSGSDKLIPGMKFQPADPTTIVNQLRSNPPGTTASYEASIAKSTSESLTVAVSGGGGIDIPILDFFAVGAKGSFDGSVFQSSFAGSKYSVKVTVNNYMLQPAFTVQPLIYNIATQQGWMYTDPVSQALANKDNTDVTGYVFDGGVPEFDFSEGGDLGYLDTLVFSQFLELSITFEQANSTQVKEYFEQHASAGISFLGIPLGGVSESSSYSYEFSDETSTSITVTVKPKAPGYLPGGTDITQSLCNLVAVSVTYPFADS